MNCFHYYLINFFNIFSCCNRGEEIQLKKRQRKDQNYSSEDADDARTRYMLRRQLRKQFAEEKHSIEEDIENFLNSVDVEGHSSNWNNFISKCKKQKSSDHDTNSNIEQHEQPTQLHDLTAVPTLSATFICYLCERKFSSLEKQERHVAESAMHLKNLQLLQKEQNS